MKGLKVLVTGGSGFIGRNLVEYYTGKTEVLAPGRKELDLLDADAVRDYFRRHRIAAVIHSATHPGHRNAKDPANVFYKNLRMYFNIVRNADRYEKLIFLGSGAVYDMRYYIPKMQEENFDTHVPIDDHGFSKYISAKDIERRENAVELRLFGVFGKYEDYAIRFISNAICKTLFDLPITIKQDRRFDYLYIEDLGPILDRFLKGGQKHGCYNVTPDHAIELVTLARKVRDRSGKNLEIRVANPGMGLEYSGDNSRLMNDFPDVRFTGIDEAIDRLYSWYSSNKDTINREFLVYDK